jgi:hypothetical protein
MNKNYLLGFLGCIVALAFVVVSAFIWKTITAL